ncbi:hypothetical protein BN9982_770013 [Mycobacterium tuberculosis]|nr:hypothetical protein BN9982_770013 [Mycobacterium tuberculosis]
MRWLLACSQYLIDEHPLPGERLS